MRNYVTLFPRGKIRALTFSYDDGATQDKRLVDILNHFNLKGTFNLNAGLAVTDLNKSPSLPSLLSILASCVTM